MGNRNVLQIRKENQILTLLLLIERNIEWFSFVKLFVKFFFSLEFIKYGLILKNKINFIEFQKYTQNNISQQKSLRYLENLPANQWYAVAVRLALGCATLVQV